MEDIGMDDYVTVDEGEDADDEISRSEPLAYNRDNEIDYAFLLLLNDAVRIYGFAARDVYNAVLPKIPRRDSP